MPNSLSSHIPSNLSHGVLRNTGYIEALPDAERLSRTGPNEFVRKCAEKTLSELHDLANR